MKKLKPYFTQANKSMGGKPEKFGLPSNKQIATVFMQSAAKKNNLVDSAWNCSCGALNSATREKCGRCKTKDNGKERKNERK